MAGIGTGETSFCQAGCHENKYECENICLIVADDER